MVGTELSEVYCQWADPDSGERSFHNRTAKGRIQTVVSGAFTTARPMDGFRQWWAELSQPHCPKNWLGWCGAMRGPGETAQWEEWIAASCMWSGSYVGGPKNCSSLLSDLHKKGSITTSKRGACIGVNWGERSVCRTTGRLEWDHPPSAPPPNRESIYTWHIVMRHSLPLADPTQNTNHAGEPEQAHGHNRPANPASSVNSTHIITNSILPFH